MLTTGEVAHVIRAHRLEPEGRDANRALADFGVPDEEAGGERLPVNLRPTGWVDEEREEILLPAVESGPAGASLLRWLKIHRELAEHGHEVRVVEPGVAVAVNRTDQVRPRIRRWVRPRVRC